MGLLVLPCLVCEDLVGVSEEMWTKVRRPAALCSACLSEVSPLMVKVIYSLRYQVATLGAYANSQALDIQRLYNAQRDVDEAVTSMMDPRH